MPSIKEMISSGELIAGKDYLDMSDGIYYFTEALMKVYQCSDSNITQKVKKFNIPKKKILDRWMYKDDIRFEKGKPGGGDYGHLIPFNKDDPRRFNPPKYSTLVARIETMNANLEILITNINKLLKEFNLDKTDSHSSLNGDQGNEDTRYKD